MDRKQTGIVLATAVATLFSAVSLAASPSSHHAAVKCMGGNACKGQSACSTSSSSCKGQNNCKGQGYIMTKSEKDCQKKGGTVAGSE